MKVVVISLGIVKRNIGNEDIKKLTSVTPFRILNNCLGEVHNLLAKGAPF